MRPVFAAALLLPASLLVWPAGAAGQQPASAARPSLSQPALSPDGNEIAFVSGGDLWTVPAGG